MMRRGFILAVLCWASVATAATDLWLTTQGPGFSTALPIPGTWDDTSQAVFRRLSLTPDTVASANTVSILGDPPRTALAYVGISPPFASSGVLDGSVSWRWNVEQHDANLWSANHIAIMDATGTLTCTALNMHSDDVGADPSWPIVMAEHNSPGTVTLAGPCPYAATDRMVMGFGMHAPAFPTGSGVFGYGDTTSPMPAPKITFSQDLDFASEECQPPAYVGHTNDRILFTLNEGEDGGERCNVLKLYRQRGPIPSEFPVATLLRHEFAYNGNEWEAPLITISQDRVRLECCCGACDPEEGDLFWGNNELLELDLYRDWVVEVNGQAHSTWLASSVTFIPGDGISHGDQYTHGLQHMNAPVCSGDRLRLTACITAHGSCAPDVGDGPCVLPTLPSDEGCPDGYTYHGDEACGPCGG